MSVSGLANADNGTFGTAGPTPGEPDNQLKVSFCRFIVRILILKELVLEPHYQAITLHLHNISKLLPSLHKVMLFPNLGDHPLP